MRSLHRGGDEPQNGQAPKNDKPMGGKICPLLTNACIGSECAWWVPVDHSDFPSGGRCVMDNACALLGDILRA